MTFRTRIQNLVKNSTNIELKNSIDKILNENLGLAEFSLKRKVYESIKEISNKDSFSLDIINRLEKDLSVDNLGIRESLNSIKELAINDTTFKYRFKAFESHLNSNTPEHLLIEGFLNSIQPYSFDENIKSIVEKLNDSYTNNKTLIDLKNLL